jgi:hypothetical protein
MQKQCYCWEYSWIFTELYICLLTLLLVSPNFLVSFHLLGLLFGFYLLFVKIKLVSSCIESTEGSMGAFPLFEMIPLFSRDFLALL